MAQQYSPHLADLVRETIDALSSVEFPLDVPGALELRSRKEGLATQLSTRLLPHLEADNVPTLVVLGGSSGAGKSTLTNSLLGAEVTEASVLRPTTRTPVVIYHPGDEAVMADHEMSKVGTPVVSENAIESLVIIDAPDLDSVDDQNRALSETLMNAADLWVFVTTASRYGDHIAWSALTEAHSRGMTVAVVLNRLPARAKKAVRADIITRMADAGLGNAPFFMIDDQGPMEGLLPEDTVAEFSSWLHLVARQHLASSPAYRTAKAVLPSIRTELIEMADGARAQVEAADMLKESARAGVTDPTATIEAAIKAGRLGAGAPTTRWLSLASSGGVLAPLVAGKRQLFGRGKDKRDVAVKQVADAIDDALTVSLEQAITAAQSNIATAWAYGPVDTASLQVSLDSDTIERAIGAWHDDSIEIASRVKAPIAAKFSTEGLAALLRAAAGGVNGARKLCPEATVAQVEQALADRVRAAVKEVSDDHVKAIDRVKIPDATRLRIKAQQLLDSVWEDK